MSSLYDIAKNWEWILVSDHLQTRRSWSLFYNTFVKTVRLLFLISFHCHDNVGYNWTFLMQNCWLKSQHWKEGVGETLKSDSWTVDHYLTLTERRCNSELLLFIFTTFPTTFVLNCSCTFKICLLYIYVRLRPVTFREKKTILFNRYGSCPK